MVNATVAVRGWSLRCYGHSSTRQPTACKAVEQVREGGDDRVPVGLKVDNRALKWTA